VKQYVINLLHRDRRKTKGVKPAENELTLKKACELAKAWLIYIGYTGAINLESVYESPGHTGNSFEISFIAPAIEITILTPGHLDTWQEFFQRIHRTGECWGYVTINPSEQELFNLTTKIEKWPTRHSPYQFAIIFEASTFGTFENTFPTTIKEIAKIIYPITRNQ
jgi:hypothetical protein